MAGAGVGHSRCWQECSAAEGGDGLPLLVEGRGLDLLLGPAGQVHLHSDTLLLPPARLTPKVLLVQSVSSSAFFHVRSWIVGFVSFSFLFFLSVSVVVPCVPVRVHLHVPLTLLPRFFVIFGLFFSGKAVPPPTQYLIDCGGLLERALCLHHRPHLLHVQHEGVERLLDVGLLLLGGVAVLVVRMHQTRRTVVLCLDMR